MLPPIRYNAQRAGERGKDAPPSAGRAFSAIRAALESEAAALVAADRIEANGDARAAALIRARARACVAPYLPTKPSTFEGAQPAHIEGQLSL